MADEGRLYIALYARGGRARMATKEDKFHWAFITGPDYESPETRATRHHVTHGVEMIDGTPQMMWKYCEQDIPTGWTSQLLVRVLIGEVKSMDRVNFIFHNTPLKHDTEGWNCVKWVEDAFTTIMQDENALGEAVTDWDAIRDKAMEYVDAKIKSGRFELCRDFENDEVPTWDMVGNKELAT
ncbi:hypothetical protein NW767_001641 [Fusarium falciforme]|nr:hypothetical protein NW767_001641 [Fusarium falciforme]